MRGNFRSGGWASSSNARGALRAGTATTGVRHEIPEIHSYIFQRFIPIYRESLFMSSIARLMKVSPLVRSIILQPSPVA